MEVLESIWQVFDGNPLLAGLLGMALTAILAVLAGGSGKRQLQRENRSLADKLARASAHANEQVGGQGS